jgi:hypothetical protein
MGSMRDAKKFLIFLGPILTGLSLYSNDKALNHPQGPF